jgi:hypothetical protein
VAGCGGWWSCGCVWGVGGCCGGIEVDGCGGGVL